MDRLSFQRGDRYIDSHDVNNDTHKEIVSVSGLEVAQPEKVLVITSQVPEPHNHLLENDLAARPSSHSPLRRKRFWVPLIVVILLVATVAVTLILKLPKKQNITNETSTLNHINTSTTSPSPSPVRTPTVRPTSVASLSPLSATAWRGGIANTADFMIRLVYQNDEGLLQVCTHDASTGNWTTAANITKAKKRSPLAITQFDHRIYGTDLPEMQSKQIELFYLDDRNYIREWNWGYSSMQIGVSGSINSHNFQASALSSLGAYWPLILYQDVEKQLHEIAYDLSVPGAWANRSANMTVLEGGAISCVPNLSKTSVIYQRDDLSLIEHQRDMRFPSDYTPMQT